MAGNFGYAGTVAGVMKIVNIVFGLICLICVAVTFDYEEIREQYFFGAVVTCFLVSIIYLIVHLASEGVTLSFINTVIDSVYHFLGAILLIVGASLFLQLIVTFNQKYCEDIPTAIDPNPALCGSVYHTKISAGAFGLINGVFYFITLGLVVAGSFYNDYEDEEPPKGYRRPVEQNK